MSIKIGIVGLPNVGKSTLFNAITNSEIEAANYPFATIEPNISMVEVIDERSLFLSKVYNSKKIIYNQIQFVDIAGLVKGASKGEGLGNQFLNNIREVDAIIHVVRLFDNNEIIHVEGNIDPIRDIETINLELILSDIEQIQKWINKNEKKILSSSENKDDLIFMNLLKERLISEKKLNEFNYSEKEIEFLKNFKFLTIKPTIYLANLSESEYSNPKKNKFYLNFEKFVLDHKENFVTISAQIEYEISKLNSEDRKIFLNEMGQIESGLNIISRKAFETLGLSTYFTAGPEEIHSWAFKKGISAPQAAGIIHSDFEKGFIKAEVFSFNDLKKFGNEQELKNNGRFRIEGKEYKIKDGDICHFRFNL